MPRDATRRRAGRGALAPFALRARQVLLQLRAEGLTERSRDLSRGAGVYGRGFWGGVLMRRFWYVGTALLTTAVLCGAALSGSRAEEAEATFGACG